MNGTRVDFHVQVHDLAWSLDGRKAAFIDGSGNLDTANPDGSGRITVAHNPGHLTWSHPAWMSIDTLQRGGVTGSGKYLLVFQQGSGAAATLWDVPAGTKAVKPSRLSLDHESGAGAAPIPQRGNQQPSGGTKGGQIAFDNPATGEVYIRDSVVRQQAYPFAQGSQPSLAPDGEGVVFVRSVAGHDHVFYEKFGLNAKPVDLTLFARTDYTEPVMSPDGTVVAARTPEGVAVLPVSVATAPKVADLTVGEPAYRP
jgi:hypothetical protein